MNNRILLVAAVAGLAIIIGKLDFQETSLMMYQKALSKCQKWIYVLPLIMDLEEFDISYG